MALRSFQRLISGVDTIKSRFEKEMSGRLLSKSNEDYMSDWLPFSIYLVLQVH